MTGRRRVSSTDVVAFELAIKCGAADAEHATGERLIAFHLLEDTLDSGAFDIFEIGSGERDVGRSRLGFRRKRWNYRQSLVHSRFGSGPRRGISRNRWRQITGVNDMSVSEGDRALDAVFQFPHIARPIVLHQ